MMRPALPILTSITVFLATALSPIIINEPLRLDYLQTIAHYKAKIDPPDYVFIGDNITHDGRNWGWEIDGNPINSLNLAINGHTTAQIIKQAERAASYQPKRVFVMAGSSDAFPGAEDPVEDFVSILKTLKDFPVTVTLAPLTTDEAKNERLASINEAFLFVAESFGADVIDLNYELAPKGEILPRYVMDKLYLSQAAYDVWLDSIKN